MPNNVDRAISRPRGVGAEVLPAKALVAKFVHLRQLNVHLVDSVMDDVRGVDPGDVLDGNYFSAPGNSIILVERTRFLDSGIFETSALGM